MKNKLLVLWIYFMAFNLQQVYSQNYQYKINQADSLFNLRKYTEAERIYEEIYEQSGQYSLSMLLKMSFLKEISGDYSRALFCLNVFYHDQPNKKVLEQMEYLAEKY